MHDETFPLNDSTFLERYEPGALLGAGGMARVWRARHRQLDRSVAIKVVTQGLDGTGDGVARFLAEARMAAGILHPNVVVVFDHGVADGKPYLVTELVEGASLADLLKARPALPVGEVLAIARQVLAGLGAIHARGIVHRDLKPDNILIAGDGSAKIADFGIAKQAAVDGALTHSGIILGTPAYMAPEQIANDPLTPATDLYAFALVLHRMITGRHPFQAATTMDMLREQLLVEAELPGDLHPAVQALLARGLRKRPEHRFASAREFADELELVAVHLERTGSFTMPELREVEPPSFLSGRGSGTLIVSPAGDPIIPHGVHTTGATRLTGASRRPRAWMAVACALALALPAAHAVVKARRPTHEWADAPETVASEPTAATLESVEASARQLDVEGAARALFDHARAHPELASVRLVSEVAGLKVAQGLDAAALSVVEASLRRPGAGSGPGVTLPPAPNIVRARSLGTAGPASPVAGPDFVLELSSYLVTGRHREAEILVRAFLEFRRPLIPGDGMTPVASTDAKALHPASAFAFVGAVAQARGAATLSELVLAVRALEVAARTHPEHPLGEAARQLIAPYLAACGDPALLGRDLVPRGTAPALARWPRLAALVDQTRRVIAVHWCDGKTVPAPDLRRALLISDVINHLNQRDWRQHGETGPYGDVRHLSTFLKERDRDPAIAWLHDELEDLDEFTIDSRLPRALVLDIASKLGAGHAPLLALVKADLPLDPPRKPHVDRGARSEPPLDDPQE